MGRGARCGVMMKQEYEDDVSGIWRTGQSDDGAVTGSEERRFGLL